MKEILSVHYFRWKTYWSSPHRQGLIPHFEQMKQAALRAGARAGWHLR
jgi:homoserine kinase